MRSRHDGMSREAATTTGKQNGSRIETFGIRKELSNLNNKSLWTFSYGLKRREVVNL